MRSARLKFPGRSGLFILYLATLMVPQAVIVIPLFLMMGALDWVDTYQGLIVPVAFSSFGSFLLRQFFLTIPQELEDAARIDGASHLRILLTIFLPLSLPALGLLALFTFTGQWNSFLWPLIAVNGPDHATLPLGLTLFQGQQGTQWNYMMAGAAISMLPGLVLTILMHRYIFRSTPLVGLRRAMRTRRAASRPSPSNVSVISGYIAKPARWVALISPEAVRSEPRQSCAKASIETRSPAFRCESRIRRDAD
jgi:ABC-type glycerol-3-phosphate transport system permease component